MSEKIKVQFTLKKKVNVIIRKRDTTARPWDWVTDYGERESGGYFSTVEDAVNDAKRVLSA